MESSGQDPVNATGQFQEGDLPPPLSHWLSFAAKNGPGQSALETPDRTFSYRELAEMTRALAARMTLAGVGPGSKVAIAATRTVETYVAILASVEVGAAYVPVDLAYPAERIEMMLSEARPTAVLGDLAALDKLRLLIGDFPVLENPAKAADVPPAGADNLAYVLFTSGSTGKPKGVAMGTLPLRHLIAWHAAHPGLGQPARVLQFAPLSFDVHFQEIFSTLACAGTLIVVAEEVRRDPALLHRALIDQQVQRLFAPYVALQMIAEASRNEAPASLREVVSAGEQLQVTPSIRSLFQRLKGAELHNHYGPTESHVVTAHELRGDVGSWPDIPPIGKALPHVRLALRDADGTILRDDLGGGNAQGELLIGGSCLATGYMGRPDLTAERFLEEIPGLPGRWYATGDLASRDAEGVFSYCGRADQQLKVDGFRIEPGEIELAIMAHDGIREAVVTAPVIGGIGKQLVAHVSVREPSSAASIVSELRAWLRRKLPEHMVPVQFIVVEALPTTPSGKIDRQRLPVPTAKTPDALPADPIELFRTLWQDLLGVARIGDEENLFDLGAKSLLVIRFVTRLKDLGVDGVGVADVYDRPTLAGIAMPLRGRSSSAPLNGERGTSTAIAVIGMAARTPDARNVQQFWQNLMAGRESIRQFAPEEIDASIPARIRERPNFVAARGVLEDADRFDASLFGIPDREATMLDPQQRLMLELCWAALENAAIDPGAADSRIGVYAGTGNNAYALALRSERPDLVEKFGEFALMLASEKDYVATRIANRLNLRGPAVSVHTACSTSLVAVAQAWHSLASGQCDVALAGGASVMVPQNGGYLHVEGGMESADGHCRPFDCDASGTVFSSGGGIVVLKRLEDALRDRDTIYCVIRGVGLNNDGGNKASFTAPSMTGQADVIRMALDHAGVSARSIGYVEAHGTGTSLGDPIEVAGLTRAWRSDTPDTQFCGLGSVKGNFGHLTAGAGVVGLIKAALSLYHDVIPATLHFKHQNAQIDFSATPFRVVDRNTEWPRSEAVRRAAVSSFGVGGTNAHVILEEPPAPQSHAPAGHPPAPGSLLVLPISANSLSAALQRSRDLAEFLEENPDLSLADVAATLMRGRRQLTHRLSVMATGTAEAALALRRATQVTTAIARPRVVFLFPGQGSQHAGMARLLYEEAAAFREGLDRVLAAAGKDIGANLRRLLIECDVSDEEAAVSLAETRNAQPALFAVSYALASWLDSLGIRPDAMIGHSIGEYAAACHAGVMSPEDAMAAVVSRGKAMFDQPRGAMLAVQAGTEHLRPLLTQGVEIAAANAPKVTTVAGSLEAITGFKGALEAVGIDATSLQVSHAFHSASMDGALAQIARTLAGIALHAPSLTVYSCVSGDPLTEAEATDPQYWARQVREPVHFSRAVTSELARGDTVFVEVGPGRALTSLLRQHQTASGAVPVVVSLLGPARAPGKPSEIAFAAVGQLWCAGVPVSWPVAATARRLPLPSYPFEGSRFWYERKPASIEASPVDQPEQNLSTGASSANLTAFLARPLPTNPKRSNNMSRLPRLERVLKRVLSEVSGLSEEEIDGEASFVNQGLDSLSLTQFALALEQEFGLKVRFRRLMEDLGTLLMLAKHLDHELPADADTPEAGTEDAQVTLSTTGHAAAAETSSRGSLNTTLLQRVIDQQMKLMSEQLALVAAQGGDADHADPIGLARTTVRADIAAPAAPAAELPSLTASAAVATPSASSLIEAPFGASPRLTLEASGEFSPAQQQWLGDFIARYNARSGKSKAFSQQHRSLMADPRVVTGFHPLWKDLVYPIVVDKSKGARLWDLDGNEYIDLLSCFGGNLLGYQPAEVIAALEQQLRTGFEVGPQHPLSADVAALISELTGMQRVAFCNTGSEAVMGAMRIARAVTGRKTIAIFTNSYHGIFDEVIVRGTRQLRSISAAPGILASAVENVIVLEYGSEDALRVLRERGRELAAIMIEPIQNKYPTLQPREFVDSLRTICDESGSALIFDEVVTGFRLAPGGAQEFYGVRADIATYGKIIGGGLPFAAIAGGPRWLDALDGGTWQYGDDSYPEAGVTYFAGTYVRHPLALAAARATLQCLKRGGQDLYRSLNDRTQQLVDRINAEFSAMGAPAEAVHCASLWRLHWDSDQKFVSLFYYLTRYHGLHLYEQFGHFVTHAMGEAEVERIVQVFTQSMQELVRLGLIKARASTALGPVTQPDLPAQPSTARDPVNPTGLDQAPLAPGQTERWLVAGYDDAARRALNESLCLSLSGNVDQAALKEALQDVFARHPAFRVKIDCDHPRQELTAPSRLDITEFDLRDRADADVALDEFCDRAGVSDFPLGKAPMAAVSLVRLSDRRVIVYLVASHLVFDGWASTVYISELAAAYRARIDGVPARFPAAESPLSFACQETDRMSGPEGEASRRFWKEILVNPPPALALGNLKLPAVRKYAADTVRASFDADSLRRLRKCARDSGATLFQLLLTAVSATLHARSGQDDFLICVPYAGQSLGRHGPLIADGVLDLPLRIQCKPSDSGADLLGRVRSHLMDALEHPLMTQGTAARDLGIRSAGDRPALTGIFFNLNPKIDLSSFKPLAATIHEGRKRAILSDLFFNFYEGETSLTLDLHYSAEHFSRDVAERITNELHAVCCALAISIATPLSAYIAAVPRDAAKGVDPRLLDWNATTVCMDGYLRVEEHVELQAAAMPDSIAVAVQESTLTYRQLVQRANRFANVLRDRGIGPGKLVGLCMSRGPDLLPALLGVLKTGAAYVPLDPGFPRDRITYMAEDSGIELVVTESRHADLTPLPRDRQLRVDDDTDAISEAADDDVQSVHSVDHPAYVIYTSGSTGRPKGVVISHRSLCNFLASMSRRPGMTSTDRLLAVTTLSFDIAVLELLLPLVTGARVVIAERHQAMDGDELAAMIGRHRVNVMQATPSTWHLLLDAGWQAPPGFRALCGGEALEASLASRLLGLGVELWNMYGPTETTVWSTLALISHADRKLSIGRPIDNTSVWILDEKMEPCAVGTPGEICIGGAGVAIEYLRRPELTAERFVKDPFSPAASGRLYRTGDLGRWLDDGTLEHLGRIDSQVKIRGYRIELGEIEARMAELPGVSRAVATVRKDEQGDVWLEGALLAKPGVTVNVAGVREALRRALPDYMIPRHVALVESIPVLPNGKIDRQSIPSFATRAVGASSASATSSPPVAPSSSHPGPMPFSAGLPDRGKPSNRQRRDAQVSPEPVTRQSLIAHMMAELLGIEQVGLEENFFELGAHSLLAARLSARIFEELGQRPGLRVVFESPTPSRLAAALEAVTGKSEKAPAQSIPARLDQSAAPLSYMQQRLWYLENLFPGTTVLNTPSGHRLLGSLDAKRLEEAFGLLVQRQSVLRTVIERTPDGDRQRILDAVPSGFLPVDDLSGLPQIEREPAMQRKIAKLVSTPFDLQRGPLFAVRLFRLAPQEHCLFFMVHHLVWDGWSFDLFHSEMQELYSACVEGRPPKLPPLEVSYGDFSAWHRDRMSGEELQRQTRYWADVLSPLPPLLALPTDRPRPPIRSGKGDSHLIRLNSETANALRRFAQSEGRTLYVTLLGAFGLMLHRMCGQNDFVIGTPVRGREQPELENLMGFFVNMLPMRLRFQPDARLAQWLRPLQAQIIEAFSCPDVPFEHLVRQLNVPRDASRTPIYQASFSYQDARERPTNWGRLEKQRVTVPVTGAAEDLGLFCVDTPTLFECVFNFNTDILDRMTVELIGRRFVSLLEQIAEDPQKSLADYDLSGYVKPTPAKEALADLQRDSSQSQEAATAGPQGVSPSQALPQTPVETAVAEIWKGMLQLEHVYLTDNFFDLGGHSLLAMRAASEIRMKFGIDPHLHHLIFENLGQISKGIEEELKSKNAPAPASQKKRWWSAVLHKFVP